MPLHQVLLECHSPKYEHWTKEWTVPSDASRIQLSGDAKGPHQASQVLRRAYKAGLCSYAYA